jgi:hypothetical protein
MTVRKFEAISEKSNTEYVITQWVLSKKKTVKCGGGRLVVVVTACNLVIIASNKTNLTPVGLDPMTM